MNMTLTDEKLKALPVEEVVEEAGVTAATRVKRPAALLFTYRCSISCAHCLFGCGTRTPSGVMSVDDALEYLRQIHQLDRAVHIAGGEPFLFWSVLAEVCEKAGTLGIAPHFVESNCFWAVNDSIVRDRLTKLRDWGVRGMYFSADPYHMAHVSPENVIRARAIAWELFGKENVMCRDVPEEKIREFADIGKDETRLAEWVRSSVPRIVGNAAFRLAPFLPDLPLDRLPMHCGWGPNVDDGPGCSAAFDPELMSEVHIDLYGNIQTNCGVIIGNAKKTSVPNLFARGIKDANPIVEILAGDGPFGLLEHAREKGCPPITHAVQKCHLCFLVRSFLRAYYPDILGPEEVYYAAPAAMLAYCSGVK